MPGFLELYEQLGIKVSRTTEHEVQAPCPFHGDETPSLSINLDTGLFKCFAANCGKGGNFEKFQIYLEELNHQLTIDPKEIETKHQALLSNEPAMVWLHKERGLTDETIKKYSLGFDAGRLWIPIHDGRSFVNVRRHSWQGKSSYGKTLSYAVGYGSVRLWPQESLKTNEIWLCEGELDCLVLLQSGLMACTTTGGAGAWKDEWLPQFLYKKVNIVYDVDEAGLEGARKVAGKLLPVAKSVKLITLPVKSPYKDITDLFVKLGKDREELIRLEAATDALVFHEAPAKDIKVYDVDLHGASQQEMVGKQVRLKVVVAGKDLAPFSAPKEARFTCRMGLRICNGCSIARNNGVMQVNIPATNPGLLKLINCNEDMQRVHIRKLVGIVPTCPRFDYEVSSYHNIEELKLLPELDYTPDVDTEYVIRNGYYIGDGIRTNQSYQAEGLVMPHPATQYVTFLFPKMQLTKTSVQSYQANQQSADRLSVFQTRSPGKSMDRWKDISADLTMNVTRIYQRDDLIYATDLVLHSVLGFNFQEQPISRGWLEGLIIGDTRCGKSETVKALVRHYKMGEIVTGENVSYAGLIGGLQQTQKRWSITWGKLPLNDRRALVIDEVSGMQVTDIERMSGTRSSGIAEISKIQTERTMARVRLLWVSNPRSARALNTYDSGANVIKELIGKPEDIARFDFCLMVSTSEVPSDVINQRNIMRLSHRFTSDLCHELLLWTWSRTRDQVIFEEEAVEACLDQASLFSKTYSAELPLVEPNEQRIKFARLGASVAARMFSTEDGINLKVKAEHIEIAANLLQRWYSNTNFNYRFYSEVKLKELDLNPDDAIIVKNVIYPYGIKFCRSLLGHTYIKLSDIEDLTGRDRKDAKMILSTLVQCGAFRRKTYGYSKTPGFIKLLHETKPQDIPTKPEF